MTNSDTPEFWEELRHDLVSESLRVHHTIKLMLPTTSAASWILMCRRICPAELLGKMDIATVAHSLEGRSPLLDHHLVELAAGLSVC